MIYVVIKKKIMIYTVTLLSIVTLLFISTTYAYYRTRIYGNTSEQSLSVTSGSVGVKYSDNNASIITGSEITPGYIVTKTFSVSNTGDSNVYFNIIFDNITNGFNKGIKERGEYNDWVYRLYSGSTKNEDNLIKEGEITTSSLQVLESNLEVKTGETNEYYLEIEYLYRQYVNQSADMGSSLSLRVNIEEFTLDNLYGEVTLVDAIINSAKTNKNGTIFVDKPLTKPAEESSGVTNYKITGEEATYANSMSSISNYVSSTWYYYDAYVVDATTGEFTLSGKHSCTYNSTTTNSDGETVNCYDDMKNKYLYDTSASSNSNANNHNADTKTDLSNVYKVTDATASTLNYVTVFNSPNEAERVLAPTTDDY